MMFDIADMVYKKLAKNKNLTTALFYLELFSIGLCGYFIAKSELFEAIVFGIIGISLAFFVGEILIAKGKLRQFHETKQGNPLSNILDSFA